MPLNFIMELIALQNLKKVFRSQQFTKTIDVLDFDKSAAKRPRISMQNS